jgi:hypothetical protein
MDSPAKLSTQGTQKEESHKTNSNTTQYLLEATMRKPTQIT